MTGKFPDRVFAFDEFGPLTIRPHLGASWTRKGYPNRLPANYHKLHGVRQFHSCYSVGDDTLWGVVRRQKSAANTLTALKSIRAARPDGAPIYIILDNLSTHRGQTIRTWAARNKVELCFTPTYSSWANPIEAHFGPLRTSSSPDRTTPTIRCWLAGRTTTCDGATPTPASSPHPVSCPPTTRDDVPPVLPRLGTVKHERLWRTFGGGAVGPRPDGFAGLP